MFTGIIEEVGHVKSLHRGAKSFTLEVEAEKVLEGTLVGDSIATNGVCLTVTSLTGHGFTADVMPETVSRTALGELVSGSPVNLERALSLQTRLGGHIVSGSMALVASPTAGRTTQPSGSPLNATASSCATSSRKAVSHYREFRLRWQGSMHVHLPFRSSHILKPPLRSTKPRWATS